MREPTKPPSGGLFGGIIGRIGCSFNGHDWVEKKSAIIFGKTRMTLWKCRNCPATNLTSEEV